MTENEKQQFSNKCYEVNRYFRDCYFTIDDRVSRGLRDIRKDSLPFININWWDEFFSSGIEKEMVNEKFEKALPSFNKLLWFNLLKCKQLNFVELDRCPFFADFNETEIEEVLKSNPERAWQISKKNNCKKTTIEILIKYPGEKDKIYLGDLTIEDWEFVLKSNTDLLETFNKWSKFIEMKHKKMEVNGCCRGSKTENLFS